MDALPSATGTDVANTGVTDLEAKRHMDDVGDVSDTATNAVDGDNDSTQPNVVPQESTAVDDKDSTKPDTVPQEHAADDANGPLQPAEGASVDAVRTDHEGTTYGSEVPHQPMAHDDVGFDTPQGQSQPQELETTMEQELESAIEELVGDINNTANTDACGVKTLVDAHRALYLQNKFGNTGVGRKDNHRQLTDK